MLVLTRKKNERIQLVTPAGDVIIVTMVRSQAGRAKIGITADKSIKIIRDEIKEDKK